MIYPSLLSPPPSTTWTWNEATKTLAWSVAGEYGTAAMKNTTTLYTRATLMYFDTTAGTQTATVQSLGLTGSHRF
jgi:hypothetical protein